MNSFIFGFHPHGLSMEAALAAEGFEVWSVNYRGIGGSVNLGGGPPDFSLGQVATVDLPRAFQAIGEQAIGGQAAVDVMGCSLGGSMIYAHLALCPRSPVHAVVAVGAPLRWDQVHPLIRLAYGSPRLAGAIRFRGVQRLASRFLPLLKHTPRLLSIYLHPDLVDIDAADMLTRTIEDPNPVINRELAEWIAAKDLRIDGTNVTEALRGARNPLLVMTANGDGVVPRATAECALEVFASPVKDFREVGDERRAFAHADLFVSNYSQELVFTPLAQWLRGLYDTAAGSPST
jgi:pimeloyl-ACP methyl ester carboxylesterase